MIFLYNLSFLLFAIFYLPFFLMRLRQAESPSTLFKQRLGILSADFREKMIGRKIIWIHAVSVGEVMAIESFLRKLILHFEDVNVVLSTVTPTGQRVANKLVGDMGTNRVHVCYFPFDLTFAVRNFFKVIGPSCMLLVETEIWPVLIREAKEHKVSLGILNARLSRKSFRNYSRFKGIFKSLFKSIDFVFPQTQGDAERFQKLGVDSECVHVLGNLKFDNQINQSKTKNDAEALIQGWHLEDQGPLFIAGSTHKGEEKVLLSVYQQLKETQPDLKLVLVPRHVERAQAIEGMCSKKVQGVMRSSRFQGGAFNVLVVDQLGILRSLYGYADLVFVGGSLIRHGGQNPIEPAQVKRAIVHGPHVMNFEDVYRRLDQEGGAILVTGEEQLLFAASRLLKNSKERETLGENACNVIESLKGATEKHVVWLSHYLKENNIQQRQTVLSGN